MLSMAALCRHRGWAFHYTSKTVPSHLKAAPTGNLKRALELGMQLTEVAPEAYAAAVASLRAAVQPEGSRFVPQGGADPSARQGVETLAEEIAAWQRASGIRRLNVVTPSGTGTTAAFLADALPACRVITAPAVGDKAYLQRQINLLLPLPGNLTILQTRSRYRFGALHPELLKRYCELKEAGIEFDLIYAPVMWTALLEQLSTIEGEILYVHSGGVGGNETMLARYARQGECNVE